MANFRAEKVLALPVTYSANTVYMVADENNIELMELYVSDSTGADVRRIPTMVDINAAISTSLSAANNVVIVSDIAERNALAYTGGSVMVLVVDATADDTVASGAATYVSYPDSVNWIKIAEHESMDVSLEWASIQNGPVSSVAAIDAAVGASHTHTNLTTLNGLTAPDGALLFNGVAVATSFSEVEW